MQELLSKLENSSLNLMKTTDNQWYELSTEVIVSCSKRAKDSPVKFILSILEHFATSNPDKPNMGCMYVIYLLLNLEEQDGIRVMVIINGLLGMGFPRTNPKEHAWRNIYKLAYRALPKLNREDKLLFTEVSQTPYGENETQLMKLYHKLYKYL